MDKLPASIFNDVIGPVMRGPSSSHVAGGARIASLARQSMRGPVVRAVTDFDPSGALAESHTGHGTDMGFACGLLGLPLTDPTVDQFEALAAQAGLTIEYRILDYGAVHPGNYRMTLTDRTGLTRHWEAIALGGGMIEMQKLEDFEVNICGDFYELLVVAGSDSLPKAESAEIRQVSDEADKCTANDSASSSASSSEANDDEGTRGADTAEISNQILRITGPADFSLESKGTGCVAWDDGYRDACTGDMDSACTNADTICLNGANSENVNSNDPTSEMKQAVNATDSDETHFTTPNRILLNFKYSHALDADDLAAIRALPGVFDVIYLEPVLPTHSSVDCAVPYSTAAELMAYAEEQPMEPWKYGAYYESCRGGKSMDEVFEQMDEILGIMESAVDNGLAGTKYHDRILGQQSHLIAEGEAAGKLVPCDPLNNIIRCISAIMESKSSMGIIVAAPTCGSCGCLPGTLIGLARSMNLPRSEVTKALFVAGLVGIFFAEEATFSAEVGGCQVECGAGSGMAAAGIVQLMHGSLAECMDAASVALQNITGLACDPVGNRVEVPCLGKNVMGGSNAVSSANMVLAGYDRVLPLDETIQAIYDIGQSLPLELRCTFGGLGKAPTARKILEQTERHFR